MADSTYEIGIQVTGEAASARAFENLKLREMEWKQETARLGAELRKLKASGEASEAQIEEISRAMIRAKQSASQYAAEARKVAQASTASSAATRGFGQALSTSTGSATTTGRSLGQLTTAFGGLGNMLGRTTNPALGQVGSVLSTVGTAVTGLTGAMGPAGLAIAAVGIAASIAIPIIDGLSDGMDEAEASASAAARSVRDLAAAFRERDAAQNVRSGIGVSAGDVSEARGEGADAIRELQRELQQAREGLYAGRGVMSAEDRAALLERARGLGRAHGSGGSTVAEAGREIYRLERRIAELTEGQEELRRAGLLAGQGAGDTGRQGFAHDGDSLRAQAAEREARERSLANKELANSRTQAQERRGGAAGGARAAREQEEEDRQNRLRVKEAENSLFVEREAARRRELESRRVFDETVDREIAESMTRTRETQRQGLVAQVQQTRAATREMLREWERMVDASAESTRTFADAWRGGLDDVITAFRQANRDLAALGADQIATTRLIAESVRATANTVADSVGNKLTSALSSSIDAWLSGAKSFEEAAADMAKNVIKSLVSEAIVQTIVETARGLAAIIERPDEAAAHFASAGMWAAVGVVAGGLGAATGAFGGGAKPSASSNAPASARQTARESEIGAGTTIINIYTGQSISTDRMIRASLVDGLHRSRRDGMSLPIGG